jgi:hypothetical protein
MLFVVIVGAMLASGVALLPPNDYQPSRPLYAAGCLAVAAALALLSRRQALWLRSGAIALAVIFSVVFVVTLFM